MKMKDQHVCIETNTKINDHYYVLTFQSEYLAKSLQPGQFINLQIPAPDCFLRRPLSIFDIQGNTIFLLYKAVGKGTSYLATMLHGQMIAVLGPLGNGYPLPKNGQHIYLIGGGTGIASLHFLFRTLKKRGNKNITLVAGFQSKAQYVDVLEKTAGKDLCVFSDDGSVGKKGFVTQVISAIDGKNSCIYACGPEGMIKAVYVETVHKQISVHVSLEEHMACGLGACLGCMVETKQGQKTVCKDGPVFDMKDIIL